MFLDAIADVKTEAQWNDKPAGRWLGARRTSLLPSGTRDNIGQALKGPLLPAEQQSNAGDGVIFEVHSRSLHEVRGPHRSGAHGEGHNESAGKIRFRSQASQDTGVRPDHPGCAARAWRRHAPDQRLPTGPDAQRAHRTSRPVARSESLTWVSQELSRRVNQCTETIADICGYRGTTSQRILFLANI